MLARFVFIIVVLSAFCGPAFGQYLDFERNLNACLNRSEYPACKYALGYSSANITPAQREQVEEKIKAIEKEMAAKQLARCLQQNSNNQSVCDPNYRAPTPSQPPRPATEFHPGPEGFVQDVKTAWEEHVKPLLQTVLLILGVIAAVLVYALFVHPVVRDMQRLKAAPDHGPMKVDISFEEVSPRTQKHRLFGGGNWWRMHMNIQLSKEDWQFLERSGYLEYELFSSPNVEFPEIEDSFPGHGLKTMPAYRDFPNISEAEAAKEKLIKGLHVFRSRIDDMRSSKGGTPERERIEI